MNFEEKRAAALHAALMVRQIEATRLGNERSPRFSLDLEQLKSLASKFVTYIDNGEMGNE